MYPYLVGTVVTRAQIVAQQQCRIVVDTGRYIHERAVGQRHADELSLGAVQTPAILAPAE